MGRSQTDWRQPVYSQERSRTLKSRLFVLLRDELGFDGVIVTDPWPMDVFSVSPGSQIL